MDLASASWRKSSHSGGDEALCVEVIKNPTGLIVIRDSKNPDGATLTLTPKQWISFISRFRDCELYPRA